MLLLPPLAGWVARGRRKREDDWSALAQPGRPPGDGAIGWLAAVACLIVALAQPRWGKTSSPPLPPGHDLVLLLDVSRSMAAEDAVPDRLGVAVESAESLVRALGAERGDRVAVVAFAGRGAVRCPLTANLGAAADVLRRLRPGDVRPGGTDLGAALDAALGAFDEAERAEGRAVVAFTDGEDHAGTWRARLAELREQGVVVHAVTIGDAVRAHPVPSGPEGRPLTYHGEAVRSKRSDDAPEELARATGGSIVRLGLAAADLGALYRSRILPMARRQREVIRAPERAERYGWFVLAGLAAGLVWSWPRRPRLARAGWLAAAALVVMGAGQGGESASQAAAAGRAAYDAGRFDEALAAFRRAAALEPFDPALGFDAAAALYQLHRFDEARADYRAARPRAGAALKAKIDYALGNTALALGDLDAAIRHYDDCLASSPRGISAAAVRRDAAINREFAEQARRREQRPEDRTGRKGSDKREHAPPPRVGNQASDGPAGEKPSPTAPPRGGPGGGPPSPRRGPGGAGGSGPAPALPGSPQDRLAKALEQIRDAEARRLPESPPPAAADVEKDW